MADAAVIEAEVVEAEEFKPFDKLDNQQKLSKAKKWLEESVTADSRYQKEAKEDFAFHAGHQWTRAEKQAMADQMRPALTFNLVKPSIDLIMGVNEENRTEVKGEPTEPSDGFLVEVLNDIDDKVRQLGELESEEDDAFENSTVSGRGFCAVDVYPDPKRIGEIKAVETSIPVYEVRLDPAGRKNDLSDHRHIFWEKWLSYEDFAIKFPEHVKDLADIAAGHGGLYPDQSEETGDIWDLLDSDNEDSDYDLPLDVQYIDRKKGRVRVIHMEYWSVYDRYYGLNPQSGQMEEFDPKHLPVLKKLYPNFHYQKVEDQKVKWFQFTERKILYDGDSPIPYEGFSIVPCFAYRDKSGASITHFGVVRGMKDPQREVNKRWSQTLNLLMKQSQGGYFAEVDAAVDPEQWNDTIDAPGETTMVQNGAISQKKFMQKEIPQFPAASMQMQEFAQDIMKKISGINPDLLGMDRGRQEPGVVVRMRQKQGLVLLANLFKNYKRMKKQLAQRRFAIYMAYMPDSQIKRILGQGDRYVFRGDLVADTKNMLVAPIRKLRDLKYDLDVQESPANMTKTMAQLAIYLDMMKGGFPVDPETVIERLDLPASDKERWKEYVKQQEQQKSQMEGLALQTKQQDAAGKVQVAQGKLQLDAQKTMADNAMKMKELEQKELEDRRNFFVDLAKLDSVTAGLIIDLVDKLSANAMRLPAPADMGVTNGSTSTGSKQQ